MPKSLRYKAVIDAKNKNSSHAQILARVPQNSIVLDVGCACGDIGAYLFQNKNCEMYGIEYDFEALEVAKQTKSYRSAIQADLNYLKELPNSLNRKYDVIILGDVLEHLVQPAQLLNVLREYLSPSGKFVISLPNIAHGSIIRQMLANKFEYMDYGILDATHLRFFTFNSIAELLAIQNLKILSSARIIYDVMGFHALPISATSPQLVKAIEENIHSFVLQYVFDATISKEPDLENYNKRMLDTFSTEERDLIADKRTIMQNTKEENDGLKFDGKKMLATSLRSFLKRKLPKPAKDILKRGIIKARSSKALVKNLYGACFNTRRKNQFIKELFNLPLNAVQSPAYTAELHPMDAVSTELPRLIAFYLPQFYPFEENNQWWGKGFTEWTNVTKAVPQYLGHYQPHLPIDLGFYDLRQPDVMERQIELAKAGGIYGFCFYYYWFSGKRLMERPIFDFLHRPELSFNFCLCWANEPWSRRWDGSEDDLLMPQHLKDEDDVQFVRDIIPFIRDKRYISINGKPLLIIYRPQYWTRERVHKLLQNMRTEVVNHGFPGLYIVMALTRDFTEDVTEWGFDAAVEFPPHGCFCVDKAKNINVFNPDFQGVVFDMESAAKWQCSRKHLSPKVFRTVLPAWDNTPRKPNNAIIYHNSSPALYGRWLRDALRSTAACPNPEERLVFINAWNEWGEGAHLEPDRKYGYAYLQETANQMNAFASEQGTNAFPQDKNIMRTNNFSADEKQIQELGKSILNILHNIEGLKLRDPEFPAYETAGFFKNTLVPVRLGADLLKLNGFETLDGDLCKAFPNEPIFWCIRARRLLAQGQLREAADAAMQARRLTPYDFCVSRIVNDTQIALAKAGHKPDYPLPHIPHKSTDRYFCEVPFVNLNFQTTYVADDDLVYSFCEALNWLPIAFNDDFSWNSPAVQEVRKSILDGSFKYCDEYRCPYLKAGTLPLASEITDPYLREIIDQNKTWMEKGPRRIILTYDRSCNLSCPSCRSNVRMANKEIFDSLDRCMEKELLPLLGGVKEIQLSLAGEALASRHSRNLLRSLTPEKYPNLEIKLFTNMSLVSKEMWQKLGPAKDNISSIHMSVDGACKETLEKLRRGLKWERLLEAMSFVRDLRQQGKLKHTRLCCVTQKDNYKEFRQLLELASEYYIDNIWFQPIQGHGELSDAEFDDKNVVDPKHELFDDFMNEVELARAYHKEMQARSQEILDAGKSVPELTWFMV